MTIDVTHQDLASALKESQVPVVVEFFAPWCGNCRRIAPVLDALEKEFADQVQLVKVNAEENPELVAKYGVTSTPTVIALGRERPLAKVIGAQPKAVLQDIFTAAAHGTSPAAATTWVPEDACRLPSVDRPGRLNEFENLFAAALHSTERREPTWLRLRLDAAPQIEDQVRDLTAREAECCDFFDFSIRPTRGAFILDVRVPPSRAEVLTGIEEQAISAKTKAALVGADQ